MNLLRRLFPKAAEMEDLDLKVEKLEADLGVLKKRHQTLWTSYNAHYATIQKQREEIDKLKAQLREQNDADLMLVSGRVICAVLRGEKPQPDDVMQHNMLMAQRQAMNLGQLYNSGLSNVGIGSALLGLGALGNIWRQ